MDYIMWNEYYESWYKGTPEDLARNLDEIHRAFPDKAIVISEYGYCACTPGRPEGDSRRIAVLREHDAVLRRREYMAGLIFFCYNDYRTHIGDKGAGVTKQRVHGVVDLYGARKPSWQALRDESSPVEPIQVSGRIGRIEGERSVPAATCPPTPFAVTPFAPWSTASGGISPRTARSASARPRTWAGSRESPSRFEEKLPREVRIDLMRPTGFSARSVTWKP